MRQKIDDLIEHLGYSIVGEMDAVRLVIVALLSEGHALLEDLPRVGKTLLVRASRQHDEIRLGISPIGTLVLQKAAQAYAFLEHRDYMIPDDVKFLVPYVFSPRVLPMSGRQTKSIVRKLLESIPIEKVVA